MSALHGTAFAIILVAVIVEARGKGRKWMRRRRRGAKPQRTRQMEHLPPAILPPPPPSKGKRVRRGASVAVSSEGSPFHCTDPQVGVLAPTPEDMPHSSAAEEIPRDAPKRLRDAETQTSEVSRHSECCVCMEAERSAVFVDCGHACVCSGCAPWVSSCPVCRGGSKNWITIFT